MDILALIPQFGSLIWTIAAFVLALSVIVAIHEYGHYIVGRWSGIKADVFSIGFGPVIWSRVDRRGTRWQLAALPFGGYVKFAGDSNAASGKDSTAMEAAQNDPERLRKTMHGAPLWARTATVAAGPVFNFVLSILIFGAVILVNGVQRDPLTIASLTPMPDAVGDLQVGDELLAINGRALPDQDEPTAGEFFDTLPQVLVLDYTVRRDGNEKTVQGPYLLPPLVKALSPQSAAMDAGLEVGDVIIAVDGETIFAFDQLKTRVEGGDGSPLDLSVWRGGEVIHVSLVPRRVDEPQDEGGFKTNWRIGIAGGLVFDAATQTPGLGEALWGGVSQVGRIMQGSVSGLAHMISGAISTCNLSGPIGIAQTSGAMASQGLASFIWFIAVLSAAVGLLNLFPIPALDGGHLVFYAYEALSGRPPSDGALRVMMTAGIALVLSLMAFALSNDILCP